MSELDGRWALPSGRSTSHYFQGGSHPISLCRRWSITGTRIGVVSAPPATSVCEDCAVRLVRLFDAAPTVIPAAGSELSGFLS